MEANYTSGDPETPKQLVVTDLLSKIGLMVNYIKSKWLLLLIVSFIGVLLGLVYSQLMKPKYTAVCSFVLEDNGREGMLGQYSGLAALAGLDGGGGGSGIFKGDNILELYKSRLMIKKTLLSVVTINGKKIKLIDRYMDVNHLKEKWSASNGNVISFDIDTSKFGRAQDSIISELSENFNKSQLEVLKPDKKLSIIKVAFTAKDEFFAKAFTDKLVENVNDFYVQTKTKKLLEDVRILQRQADSVKSSLNISINGVASSIESSPLANPILTSLRSSSQRKQVDVQASTAIYGEIVKNLELSKITLRQQTPLIQFIDQPVYPLKTDRVKKFKGMVVGGMLSLFLIICFLSVKWFIKDEY
jgi:hypothetical protein